MIRVVSRLDTITITTTGAIVFDDAGQPRTLRAEPMPVYRVAVIDNFGQTLVSSKFWDRADAQRAETALKEKWEQKVVPYIGPTRRRL